MRHFFIVLMIALLPLRSWAGDVMGLEMAVGHTAGTVQTVSKATPDCHGQMAEFSIPSITDPTVASGIETTESMADGRCDTCGTCQICHSVGLADFSFSQMPSLAASNVLSSDGASFASAPRALSLKPPIS